MTSTQPDTKTARHGAILDILASREIASQEQLREVLRAWGIETTQATLSRDLLEMRATKVRTSGGTQVYTVPDVDGGQTHAADVAHSRLVRWCQDLLVAADLAGNLLVLRTPVGAANLLASAIDAVRLETVVGTIAGDDTVLVICRDAPAGERTRTLLFSLAEPRPTPAAESGDAPGATGIASHNGRTSA